MNQNFESSVGIKTTRLAYCAMLIAFSAIGSMVKISGTIALDSLPGFYAALYISPILGAVVAGMGHLLTALTSGFPLTLPMHLVLMVAMAGTAFIFGWVVGKTNGFVGCVVGILLNGPGTLFISSTLATSLGLPLYGKAMFIALLAPLTLASAANIILAYLIYRAFPGRKGY